MLTALRYGAGSSILKYLVFGLIFAAMAGMAVMDIGGFFRSGGVGRNNVAVVGHNAIGINEFYRLYQNTLRQANIDPKTAAAAKFPYAVLNQEITRRLLSDAAYRAKIRVGETYIADQLAKQLDGMGITAEKRTEFFKDYLRRTGMSEAGIIADMRQQTATALLMDSVQQKIDPADLIVKQLYVFEKEKRNAHILTVSYDGIGNLPNFSDKEIKEFYDTNPSLSAIPETRNLSYVILSKEEFLKDLNVSDEAVNNYYKENASNFIIPATRNFEQVIAKSQEDADKVLAAIGKDKSVALKAAAESALGKDTFEYVASQPYAREGLPAEIAAAAFPEETKAFPFYTAAVKTGYGYHVIRVVSEQKAEQKPLTDALKKEIVAYLRDTQAEEAVYKASEKIEDMAASGSTIAEIAKELSLPIKTIKGVTAQGTDAEGKNIAGNIENAKAIIDNGFQIGENEVSPIIEGGNVTLLAVGADKINAASRKPIDVVKNEIKTAMLTRFKSSAAREKADEILKKAIEGKKPLQALADEYNLPFTQTKFAGRTGDAKADDISDNERGVLFRLSAKDPVQSVQTEEGIRIIALGSIKVPDATLPKGEETETLRSGYGQAVTNDILEQFASYRREKLGVKINEALIAEYFYKNDETE